MWPRLGNKEEQKGNKTIAQIVAGDELCMACGSPAEIFNIDEGSNFCMECYYAAPEAAATTPSTSHQSLLFNL